MSDSRRRFTELLPFYVNGTLSEADRRWVDEQLQADAHARAELEFMQALRGEVIEQAPKVPSTIGLARTLTLIGGDRPSWRERVAGFFFGGSGLRPALALGLLAVVAIQGGVIASLLGSADDDAGALRSGQTVVVQDGPLLKLNFAATASEADIRFALLAVQGTLVGGPGQLGDYFVRVPAGKEQAALATLRGTAGVQQAELVAGLPAAK